MGLKIEGNGEMRKKLVKHICDLCGDEREIESDIVPAWVRIIIDGEEIDLCYMCSGKVDLQRLYPYLETRDDKKINRKDIR